MRISLDRDPTHPIKAKVTRWVIRQLHLNWTSFRNDARTTIRMKRIFTDIQQQILDNSDDPDARATQRRISSHLKG